MNLKGNDRKVTKNDTIQNAILEGYLASVLCRAILEHGVKKKDQ